MKKLPPLVVLLSLFLAAVAVHRMENSRSAEAARDKALVNAPASGANPAPARAPAVAKAAPGVFWTFGNNEAAGNSDGLDGPSAAISRGKNLLPSGKRHRIQGFPDLVTLVEGETVKVTLPDGRAFDGRVNWSRRDEGYVDAHQVSIGFAGNQGGLTALHDGTTGRTQGRLLVEHDPLGWTLEPDPDGGMWLVEHLREDLVCELIAAARSSQLPGDSGVTGSGSVAPVLNSRGSATAVLYIDFDGQPTQTYPDWPGSNPGGVNIAVTHSGMTADQMTRVWRRVAEDYIQFNVNVTTELAKYNAATPGKRMRILVGGSLTAGVNGAGVALIGSFSGLSFASNVPCWLEVSPNYGNPSTMTDPQFSSLANNISHEFGHTLGLWHDGNDGIQPTDADAGNYYTGHGTAPFFDWSPIMGNAYRSGSTARAILQWARNDYPGANNSQDDIAVIAGATNGFGYSADESTGIITSTTLAPLATNQVGGEGIIANRNDLDWWQFQVTRAGSVTVTVEPADRAVSTPNLDCGFRIENAAGTIVAGPFSFQDNLTAEAVNNLAVGTYHVVAYGTGNRQFSDSTGYNDYGSTGRYLVTVNLPPDISPPVAAVVSPAPGSVLSSPSLVFSGTASDDEGVSGLSIYLRRNSDNHWWNGTGWQSTSAGAGLARTYDGGTHVWTCTATLPPVGGNSPNALGAGTYAFIVVAEDAAGHSTQADSGVTVDTAPPVTTILAPLSGSVITTSSVPFHGQVTDNQGVNYVVLFIRRLSDNLYWDGGAWIAESLSANLSASYNSANGTWTCTDTLPVPGSSLANGNYAFIAIGIDNLGNSQQTDSFVAVDFHQVYQWTAGSFSDLNPNNNDYYWGNPANWSPNGIPDTQDIVNIDLNHTVRSTISRTVYGFNISAGGLDFDNPSDSLTITKQGNWTGGALSDTVNIQSTAAFQLSGTAIKLIGDGSAIRNSGAVTWTGPGLLQGYQNSTWQNKPGSSFTMLTDGDVFANYSPGNVFNNEAGATFVKTTGGVGTSTFIDEWTFNNNGAITSQQGTLHFQTTLNINPGSTFAGAGRILLGGTSNLAAALTSTGNPELIGTLNATAASFSGTQPFVWTSGQIAGGFTLAAGSVLDLVTANTKLIGSGATFTNLGRINWKAGLLQGYQNSTLNNESGGIFDVFTDGDVFANFSPGNVFNNKAGALFIKSGKSAAPDGESVVDDWTFNNSGVIRSDTGILRFHTPLNLNGGGTVTRSGALTAKVRSTQSFVLTGTTTVTNITFEAGGDWHGNLSPGTAGNGTLATSGGGAFEWTSGVAHNTLNIAAGSTFSISGTAVKQIGGGGVLNNAGSATWTGTGAIQGYQNSTFVNLAGASFTCASDADFVNFSPGNTFSNRSGASFEKTAGTEDNRCDWAFDNQGLMTASSGAVALNSGGTSSGTFAPAAGGLVRFSGGSHSLITTASIRGAGKTQITGGTVTAVNHVNASSPATTLEISGGAITSAVNGSFSAVGTVTWTGGNIGGVFHVTSGSSINLSGGTTKQISDAGVINNFGSATWTGTGLLQGYQNTTWNNKPGASFTVLTDGDVFANYSPGNVFNNEAGASFVKTTAGVGTSSFIDEWTFNNNGSITSQQGTLHFQTNLNLNPGSTFAGAGRILLGGTSNLAAALTSTGNPELIGTLNATAASFSGSQPFVWTSGVINGGLTLAAGSVLDLVTANTKQLGGSAVLTNFGRINWKAGLLQGYQNSTLNNESGGIFDVFTDGDVFANYSPGNVFNNKAGALFVKSGVSGTPDASSIVDEWTFNNSGSIRSDSGLLRFHTPLMLEAGGTISRTGALPARVLSSHYFVLTGTTTVSNVVFESSGDWHGNLTSGSAGNGTIATQSGGVFEWTAGTAHNTVNLAPGAVFSIAGPGFKQIGGGGFINNGGVATRTGNGELRGYQNSSFVNLSGGTFNVATSAPFTNFSGGNRLTNSGVLNIGAGAAISPLHWNFTQTGSGKLNLEIGGTNAATPQFDQFNVSGQAVLAGTLGVSRINGFAPLAGATFPVLTFGSRSGTFGAVQGAGSVWGTQYNSNNLTLVAKTYPTTRTEWTGYFFTDPDAPEAQPFADPDFDGVPNVLEYGLGGDPHGGGGSGSVAGTVEIGNETYLTLTFTRPAGEATLTDVTYGGERSPGLLPNGWSSAGVVTHGVVPVPGQPKETVTLRSVYPVSDAENEFLHLKVAVGQ